MRQQRRDCHRDIRRGDIWEYQTNSGVIMRHVKSVAYGGVVSYTCNGRFKQCQMATFKRWLFGATLTSATDWTGRDNDGFAALNAAVKP